jgi:hypothetical protein
VGLHVNFTNEAQRLLEFDDPLTCRSELRRQFEVFCEKMGRLPTHLDSHQHVHRDRRRRPFFKELAREHGMPLRDNSPVLFKGGFYAQWQYGVTDPAKVSYEALTAILAASSEQLHELAVPGYVDQDGHEYHRDRGTSSPCATPACLSRRHLPHRLLRPARHLADRQYPLIRSAHLPKPAFRRRGRVCGPGQFVETWAPGSARRYARPSGRRPPTSCCLAMGLQTLLLWLVRRRATASFVVYGLYFLFCLACVVYAVASVQIFAYLRSPLTYALLYLADDMDTMSSSIGQFLSGPMAAAFLLGPAFFVLAVRRCERRFPLPRSPFARGLQSLGLGALLSLLLIGHETEQGPWRDRDDRRIAQNPHWTMVSTYALEILSPDHSGSTSPSRRAPQGSSAAALALASRVSMGGAAAANVIVFVLRW